jgi:hypothetical protein
MEGKKMSAYIVEDETINKIMAGIVGAIHNGGYPHFQLTVGFYAKCGAVDPQTLGELLFDLNIQGVEARYGEGEAEKFRPLDYKYQSVLPLGDISFLKSLQCLLYQCSEGEVPETPLFKAMEKLSHDLALHIVESSAKYESATWG